MAAPLGLPPALSRLSAGRGFGGHSMAIGPRAREGRRPSPREIGRRCPQKVRRTPGPPRASRPPRSVPAGQGLPTWRLGPVLSPPDRPGHPPSTQPAHGASHLSTRRAKPTPGASALQPSVGPGSAHKPGDDKALEAGGPTTQSGPRQRSVGLGERGRRADGANGGRARHSGLMGR